MDEEIQEFIEMERREHQERVFFAVQGLGARGDRQGLGDLSQARRRTCWGWLFCGGGVATGGW